MKKFYVFIFIIAIFLTRFKNTNKKIIKPVIGIYGNPNPIDDDLVLNSTTTPNNFVFWLESFGAETMMIHFYYDYPIIDEILNKLDGIILIGGKRIFDKNKIWEQKAAYIIKQAKEKKIPLWGTCQGFQLIATILSNNYSLLKYLPYNDYSFLHSLNLTTNHSIMFGLFKDKDIKILEKENSTFYFHYAGFIPEEWNKEKKLLNELNVLSVSQDKDGLQFINAFESKSNNGYIFGTQFHSEINPYCRYNFNNLPLKINNLKVSQLIGIQFVEQCRNYQKKFNKKFYEKDRNKFDFIYTYNNKTRAYFNYTDESFIFWK